MPGSPAGGRGGACLPLSLVIRCSSTGGSGLEFWRPGALCWSPVRSTLRQLKSSRSSSDLSRWLWRDFFLSLLVAPLLEAPQLLRVTASYLAFGLTTAVFRCGGGFTAGYGWSPVFPSFGSGGRRCLVYP